MAVAKRHHTVPQFYLRGFADDQQIVTVRLPGERRFVQSVRKAASETNFYAVDGHEDGPDAFEKLLAPVEGEAANIFATVVDGTWPLAPDARLTLAHFVALQAVRGPDQRRNMENLAAQFTRLEIGYGGRAKVKDWAQQKWGLSVTDEQAEELWQQAIQPGGPPIRFAPIAHIRQMVELVGHLVPYIAGRPWSLVRFDKRALLTCDAPVSLIPHQESEPFEGVGFLTAWGISYPLTRRLGLLMSDPMVIAGAIPVEEVRAGRMDGVQAGTTQLEKSFNHKTVDSAGQWLYHHPEDGRFVPDKLPAPNLVPMQMAAGPEEFSGEPIFGRDEGQQSSSPSVEQ